MGGVARVSGVRSVRHYAGRFRLRKFGPVPGACSFDSGSESEADAGSAEAAARRAFGNVTLAQEELLSAWSLAYLGSVFLGDLRLARSACCGGGLDLALLWL